MISSTARPFLRRLFVEGELAPHARQALAKALDDPGTVEWRECGNTLQIDIDKKDGRVQLTDLLDSPDAPAETVSTEGLKAILQKRLLTTHCRRFYGLLRQQA
jgi:hypothetical protein